MPKKTTAAAAAAPADPPLPGDEAPRRWIDLLPLDQVKPAKRNPKDHDIGALHASADAYGYVEAMTLDERTGRLVAGHGRLEMLQQKKADGQPAPEGVTVTPDGRWMIPVQRGWASKDDAHAQGYLLASNHLTTLGGWKDDELASMLADLAKEDALLATGFDGDDLDRLLGAQARAAGRTQVDDVPDLPAKADTWVQPGMVFRLGAHLLACGDSTDPDTVDAVMGKDRASLCFTDPPWNVDLDTEGRKGRKTRSDRVIANDALGKDFAPFMAAFVRELRRVARPGCMVYLCMAMEELPGLKPLLDAQGFHWSTTLIWLKDSFVMSRADYHRRFEPIWYGWLGTAPRLHPVPDRKQDDVWEVPRPSRSEIHPTMKPVDLVARAVANSSTRGDVVWEPFSGSGSTLIACEQLGRSCRAVELDPRYVQAATKRWEDFTGQKAERLK